MLIRLKGGEIEEVKLNIFEPPRFFEAFLRGRYFTEAPDITARICGICPVAYQTAAINSMSRSAASRSSPRSRSSGACSTAASGSRATRSHLHAARPDFLGYPSAIEIAADAPEIVETALRLKKIGNHVMTVVGGREIHPINVKVGGFYKAPGKAELEAMVPDLEWALETSLETVKWASTLDFPTSRWTTSSPRSMPAASIRSRAASASSRTAASTSRSTSSTSTWSRSTPSTRTRCKAT